ncbi:MAG: oxidoreductase [Cryobacterium sp.]|jgi:predicted dehydrogenase|nr:oxidoreductase [Cryobacterium sp.]
MSVTSPLRIGVLGAARITDVAIVQPAHEGGHELRVVAARDRVRAEEFAREHHVTRVADSYQDVISADDIDLIYNPLANALHARWNLEAIRKGIPVLAEKPFANNTQEAREVVSAAREAGVPVFEAFHYIHHPGVRRAFDLLRSGTLGALQDAVVHMAMPMPAPEDPRLSFLLGGGALMDLGCYAVHALRTVASIAGSDLTITSAEAVTLPGDERVDQKITFTADLGEGARGRASCDMDAAGFDMSITLTGANGKVTVKNFIQPHNDDRVVIELDGEETTEHSGRRSSYAYQLDAVVASLVDGAPFPVTLDDSLAVMELVDELYGKVGLPLRGSAS